MKFAPALAVALALSGAAAAHAQSPTGVEQLHRGPAEPSVAAQVGAPPPASGQMPQLSGHDGAPRARQLSGPAEGRAAQAQLSASGTGAASTPQLAGEARTAEGPAALSSPAQGRNPRVERLEGDDRCDPRNATNLTAAEAARCAQVIERRSAEFTRPEPREPSPEERLLRFHHGDGTSARTAARALADGDVEGSLAAQAIASAANRPTEAALAPRTAPAQPELTPEAQAVIDAIVKGAATVTVR